MSTSNPNIINENEMIFFFVVFVIILSLSSSQQSLHDILMPKITPRDTLCTYSSRVGTQAFVYGRKGPHPICL